MIEFETLCGHNLCMSLGVRRSEKEEGEAKITRCQSNSGILGESDGRTDGPLSDDQISSGARARPQLMAQIDFGKVACCSIWNSGKY